MQTAMREEEGSRAFTKGIWVDILAYLAAFGAGMVPFLRIGNLFAASAAFTATATLLLFAVSVLTSDVSVYDPYWSVAPPFLFLAVMCKYGLWNRNAVILLALIGLWAFRLTANWLYTYRGLGQEDWRYAMYRKKYSPLVFQLISFFGLHFVPTAVVYAGMVSALYAARESRFAPLSILGILVMLGAVALSHTADKTIHAFLEEHRGEGRTCDVSVWKYSRHPNYLGEMAFWTGLYLYFAALLPEIWYRGLWFLTIILLFLTVSIPMMEKHNLERRADYAAYKATTSMLFLLPPKRRES